MEIPNKQGNREVTLDINGHTFLIDFARRRILPKGDENSTGIPFRVFKTHFMEKTDRCEIPYDTKKHEFVKMDYRTVTAVPENVILVAFPHLDRMAPTEYSVMGGWAREDFEPLEGQQNHFTATILKGESNWLDKLAKINQAEQKLPQINSSRRSRQMGR